VLLLFAATLLVYLPAIMGGYIWDDDAFVTANPVLRAGWDGLRRLWFVFGATDQYYPMAYSSFWLEYQAWGYWAAGSHLVNALLHALNAWLLWKALRSLGLPGAWLAAFIFALHPVEVESVAWITERKNVLSMTFYLLAALAWFRFQPPAERTPAARDWRWYGAAVLLFLFALWSKTVTCSLPAALLLVMWWRRERITWSDALPLAPLFAIGAGMGLMTGWMEKHVIGAKGNDWSLTLPERFLIAGRAPWFYLGKLLWPEPLMFFYPRWRLDAGAWWQWIYPVATAGALAALWLARRRIGKGPVVAAGFFLITLFPALGFIDVYPFRYSFVADHFQYLASVGPIALAAAGMTARCRFFERRAARLPPVFCGVLLVTLGGLTWRQGWMYSDQETFYKTIIARNPGCWMAYDNLAFERLQSGRTEESIALSRQALGIKPDDPEARVNLADALVGKGRAQEAEALYREALAIRPDFPEAQSDLGNVLLFEGKVDEAIEHYRRALELRPQYAEAHNNLGFALLKKRRFDEAIAEFRKALALEPDYSQARANLEEATAGKQGR
jgi:Tfp pilus assembly protein PilF